MTILGIDPGYDRVGWGVGETHGTNARLVACGCILTKKSDSLFKRYESIDAELEKIIVKFRPAEAAVESLFFTNNQKTALHVSEARGVILSCLFHNQVRFSEYTPLQIKQAVTGYGRADKSAVEKMVRLQLAGFEKKLLDDTLDAIAVMLTHAASRGKT